MISSPVRMSCEDDVSRAKPSEACGRHIGGGSQKDMGRRTHLENDHDG